MVIDGNFKTHLEAPGRRRPENTASKFITPRGARAEPMMEYIYFFSSLSEGMIMKSFAAAMTVHGNICSSQVPREFVSVCVSFIPKCTARLYIFLRKIAVCLNAFFFSLEAIPQERDNNHLRGARHTHLII